MGDGNHDAHAWLFIEPNAARAGDDARSQSSLRLLDRAWSNGSLGGVFDHVMIAVADLAASERFYRTVPSVLGAEPSHADAEIVEWADWDALATDRSTP